MAKKLSAFMESKNKSLCSQKSVLSEFNTVYTFTSYFPRGIMFILSFMDIGSLNRRL
jgi:hypothetical protein